MFHPMFGSYKVYVVMAYFGSYEGVHSACSVARYEGECAAVEHAELVSEVDGRRAAVQRTRRAARLHEHIRRVKAALPGAL